MPTITNIATGKKYRVSEEGMRTIQDNEQTRDLYTYPAASDVPDEVVKARQAKADKVVATDERVVTEADLATGAELSKMGLEAGDKVSYEETIDNPDAKEAAPKKETKK